MTKENFILLQDPDPDVPEHFPYEPYPVSASEAEELVFSGNSVLAPQQSHPPITIARNLVAFLKKPSKIGPSITDDDWDRIDAAVLRNGVRQLQVSGRPLPWFDGGDVAISAFEAILSGCYDRSQNAYAQVRQIMMEKSVNKSALSDQENREWDFVLNFEKETKNRINSSFQQALSERRILVVEEVGDFSRLVPAEPLTKFGISIERKHNLIFTFTKFLPPALFMNANTRKENELAALKWVKETEALLTDQKRRADKHQFIDVICERFGLPKTAAEAIFRDAGKGLNRPKGRIPEAQRISLDGLGDLIK